MNQYFLGYPRPDGSVGVRNHVLMMSLMDLTNPIAQQAASLVRGAISICPSFGRGQVGIDVEMHDRVMAGLAANANVHSVILVSMEAVSCQRVEALIQRTGKKVVSCHYGDYAGSLDFTVSVAKIAKGLIIKASEERRTEVPISKLMIGLKCGGSDTTSGIIANPVTGMVSDTIVDAGGTVIMSETLEWLGAEHIIAKRAATPATAKKILDTIRDIDDYIDKTGIDVRGGQSQSG